MNKNLNLNYTRKWFNRWTRKAWAVFNSLHIVVHIQAIAVAGFKNTLLHCESKALTLNVQLNNISYNHHLHHILSLFFDKNRLILLSQQKNIKAKHYFSHSPITNIPSFVSGNHLY